MHVSFLSLIAARSWVLVTASVVAGLTAGACSAGFIALVNTALNRPNRFEAFRRDMGDWVGTGRVKLREDLVDGLDNAPAAFIDLLEGRHFGKLVVRVADA
jgi:NADPH-dependent curcumin reductase CurA